MVAAGTATGSSVEGHVDLAGDPADAPDLVGAVLQRQWQIVRHIALGSMGHVYEARHLEDGPASVAVKVLHTGLVREADVAFRFRREAEILERIDSPHVPRVFDRGSDDRGRPFFVMERMTGPDLAQLLYDHHTLPLRLSLEIARQACVALSAAHRAGITHRDLKPENISVCGTLEAPDVRVFDFSVSKTEDIALTAPGTLLGTPAYMPPEQALGHPVTVRFDVYAVGAILYEMLTGRPPFDDPDTRQTLALLLTKEAPRPRALVPSIPERVEQIILTAIAKDPSRRYATVEDLERALARELAELAAARRSDPAPSAPVVIPVSHPVVERPIDHASVPTRPSAPPSDAGEVAMWTVGFGLLGAALVVLANAAGLTRVPLWLAPPSLVLGCLLGWVLGATYARISTRRCS